MSVEEKAEKAWFVFAESEYGPEHVRRHEESEYHHYMREKRLFVNLFHRAIMDALASRDEEVRELKAENERLREALESLGDSLRVSIATTALGALITNPELVGKWAHRSISETAVYYADSLIKELAKPKRGV